MAYSLTRGRAYTLVYSARAVVASRPTSCALARCGWLDIPCRLSSCPPTPGPPTPWMALRSSPSFLSASRAGQKDAGQMCPTAVARRSRAQQPFSREQSPKPRPRRHERPDKKAGEVENWEWARRDM